MGLEALGKDHDALSEEAGCNQLLGVRARVVALNHSLVLRLELGRRERQVSVDLAYSYSYLHSHYQNLWARSLLRRPLAILLHPLATAFRVDL